MTKKKSKSNFVKNDTGVYNSDSSVDKPPKKITAKEEAAEEALDAKPQTELPGIEKTDDKPVVPYERKFKVELKLSLTPSGDKAISIPVLVGEYPSGRVTELLTLSLTSRRFKKILEAVLDNPIPEPKEEPKAAVTVATSAETPVSDTPTDEKPVEDDNFPAPHEGASVGMETVF